MGALKTWLSWFWKTFFELEARTSLRPAFRDGEAPR
jgi:hypothetical protein